MVEDAHVPIHSKSFICHKNGKSHREVGKTWLLKRIQGGVEEWHKYPKLIVMESQRSHLFTVLKL